MFIAGNLPFNFVEHPEFICYMTLIRPDIRLPSRWKLRNMLEARYTATIAADLPGLGPTTKVSLALALITLPFLESPVPTVLWTGS
jgi:hypothetical protein